jgi:hypothetical protein
MAAKRGSGSTPKPLKTLGTFGCGGVQPAVLAAVVCGELTPYDFGARYHSQVVREVCREPSCKHAKLRLGWTRARQVSKP